MHSKWGRLSAAIGLALALTATMGGLWAAAQGDYGRLDQGFGTSGKLQIDGGGDAEQLRGVAVQPDGKIVLVGSGKSYGFTLLRRHPNSATDLTFGYNGSADGMVVIDGQELRAYAEAVVIQPDGKIVVAGMAFQPDHNRGVLAVARFLADGSPDSDFGSGGIAWYAGPDGAGARAEALALQDDGKIVVAGSASDQFLVVRYLPNGDPDEDFGDGGAAITDISTHETANAVAIQPDGKIVITGLTVPRTGTGLFTTLRYDPDGALDSSFGEGGVVLTDMLSSDDFAQGLALQPDGKIVVAGSVSATVDYCGEHCGRFAVGLVRYNPDGSIDTSFGDGGKSISNASYDDWAVPYAMVRRSDGKLVLAGSYMDEQFAVLMYNADGTPDTRFGDGGIVKIDFSPSHDRAFALALQPDGKIVAAGDAAAGDGSPIPFDYAVARIDAPPSSLPAADATPTVQPTPTATPEPPYDPCDDDNPAGHIFYWRYLRQAACGDR